MAKNPIIRFKGVDKKTELTSTPASEIFETINERDYSDLPVLSASQELGMVYRNEDGGSSISYNKDNLSSYKHICPGQFAIHLRSFQGGFAHSDKEGICSPAYTIMRFKTPIHDEYYWKYLLTSEKFIKRLELITYGIRDGRSINFEDFSTFNFDVPSFNEQKDIGTFFTHITSLIASTQEKLEKAIILKKSMLEKMFPKDGAKVPELRLKGFSDEYEYTSTLKLFEVINDKNHPELPVLSASQEYGMVYRNETGGSNISYNKNNQDTYKRILPGQFAIHLRSFQGGFAHSDKDGICSPAYTIMKFVEPNRNDEFYWKYLFTSDRFIKRLELITYGIRDGRSISFEDFSTFYFYLPTKEEQKKIGSFFVQMDSLIYSYRNELEKLKTIKKSLLEKMFV